MVATFDLVPISAGVILKLAATMAFLLVLAVYLWLKRDDRPFLVTLAAIPTLFLFVAFAWFIIGGRDMSVSITQDELILDVPLYGRHVPLRSLDITGTTINGAGLQAACHPASRTNGLGMVGYQLGWFKLQGGNDGLLAVTASPDTICVPTTTGFSMVLSVSDAAGFLTALSGGSTK